MYLWDTRDVKNKNYTEKIFTNKLNDGSNGSNIENLLTFLNETYEKNDINIIHQNDAAERHAPA